MSLAPVRAPLRLQPLEARDVPAWAGIAPAAYLSNAPVPVNLAATGAATGSATITANEVDAYRFAAPTTGLYRIAATTPASSLDTVVGLFNADGSRLRYNDDVQPADTDSLIWVNLVAGRTYTVGVTNYTGTPGGSYSWQVKGPAPAADDPYEQNDTRETAAGLGELRQRRRITGLALADDADWFRFTTTATGRADHYAAISFSTAAGDLSLSLTDAEGRLVRRSDTRTNQERLSLNGLPAGTYSLLVSSSNGGRNPSYSLDIHPGVAVAPSGRNLYVNFDGAKITQADLRDWAGSDWAGAVSRLDADGNGIGVAAFLPNRADREAVIARALALLRADLAPFGVTVVRTTGTAVTGVGATTVFVGRSTLSNGLANVASAVDLRNDNATDIAFIADEDWGSVERTALAAADNILHESGHTWGLWHVASGGDAETMGLRYGVTDSAKWAVDTGFLDRSYPAYVEANGFAHGPGSQNSYRTMTAVFGGATQTLAAGSGADLPSQNPTVADEDGLMRSLTETFAGCACATCRLAAMTFPG